MRPKPKMTSIPVEMLVPRLSASSSQDGEVQMHEVPADKTADPLRQGDPRTCYTYRQIAQKSSDIRALSIFLSRCFLTTRQPMLPWVNHTTGKDLHLPICIDLAHPCSVRSRSPQSDPNWVAHQVAIGTPETPLIA